MANDKWQACDEGVSVWRWCAGCATQIIHPISIPGRRPKYCSDACKQREYRWRKSYNARYAKQKEVKEFFS